VIVTNPMKKPREGMDLAQDMEKGSIGYGVYMKGVRSLGVVT
jgi:hypothetical protein